MYLVYLLEPLITLPTKTPLGPLRLDSSLKGKRGENRWCRYQPLRHNSGGKNFHQTSTYSFIRSNLDSRSRLAALWGFLREWPAWKRLHHRCRGRPLAESSWPPPRGPDDLGRSSARPHQGAAVLQILRVNFYDKCLCKVMHIDFHVFDFFSFPSLPLFLSGSKGRMCQTVMYLVWESPGGVPPFFSFFFFSFSSTSSSSQRSNIL